MEIAVWILQALVALAFLGSGVTKLVRPRPALAGMGYAWVDDFSDTSVKGCEHGTRDHGRPGDRRTT